MKKQNVKNYTMDILRVGRAADSYIKGSVPMEIARDYF